APLPAGAIQPIGERYDELPLGNIRKIVARRLTESKQTIPHFYLTIDCALDALLQLRKDLNGRDGADYKLSVNDFVIKAAALALKRVPDANASWGGDRIYRYQDVDVSVAVAIAEGLITPIVRGADQKGLGTISNVMKDLAARARENKLKPEEFQGGSFSISNLGMYGVREFAAVINPPQACILSVGAGEQRPVVKDGALATATMMSVTLSVDHRVVDGALGAQLLQAFKGYIEDPLSMLL
ncbi:MAG: 2-oxo acid dehydrogenase subunit E2, partial [Nitrospirota bacterium]|nr:2-oxo acid dehydrogenase subunit E2 [Nitrospirota bacterium]